MVTSPSRSPSLTGWMEVVMVRGSASSPRYEPQALESYTYATRNYLDFFEVVGINFTWNHLHLKRKEYRIYLKLEVEDKKCKRGKRYGCMEGKIELNKRYFLKGKGVVFFSKIRIKFNGKVTNVFIFLSF